MNRLIGVLPTEHDGLSTALSSPQNSSVVPQKPEVLQQTLRGHVSMLLHCVPSHPGLHSDLASQLLRQPSLRNEANFHVSRWPLKEIHTKTLKVRPVCSRLDEEKINQTRNLPAELGPVTAISKLTAAASLAKLGSTALLLLDRQPTLQKQKGSAYEEVRSFKHDEFKGSENLTPTIGVQ